MRQGSGSVDAATLRFAYNRVGAGLAGRMEDPPEDVFVYQVRTRVGNFRTLEGMWEGNGFYLQRIIDLLEMLPSEIVFKQMRASALAMLRLSETLCERAKLARWTLGNDVGRDELDAKGAARLLVGRNRLQFSLSELRDAQIELPALSPFLFNMLNAADLLRKPLNETPLETRPLVFDGGSLHVILPTALGAAIRSFVISTLQANGNADAVKKSIVNVYSKLWFETPLLGAGSHRRIEV